MRYIKRKPWLAIVLVVAFILFSEMPLALSLAQEPETTDQTLQATTTGQRLIQVSGTGEVTVQPDVAVFFVGVETEAEDPGSAISQNSERTQDLIDALIQEGVSEANIQTQLVSLQPIYAQPEAAQASGTSQVAGYRAINIVRVRTEDLENLGALLNTVVEAGANRIDSLFFEATSQMDVYNEALQAAWDDAQQKAQLLAELANAELGDVVTISTIQVGGLGEAAGLGLGGAGGAVPVEPGRQTVTVNLLVTWELESGNGGAPTTPTPTTPTTITPTPTLPTPTPLVTTPETPTSGTPTALPTTVATSVRRQLAEQLGLTERNIVIVSAERQEWPDACLGLARANEVCAQVVTQGWLVVVEVNSRRYEVRTDLTGNEVRIVEQPTTAQPTTTAQLTPTAPLTATAQLTTTVQPTVTGQAPTS